jgi:hypothetical protein
MTYETAYGYPIDPILIVLAALGTEWRGHKEWAISV